MYFPTRAVKARVSIFKAMASPKRVFGMITAGLTFLTFARVVVCLVEAYVAVRSERMHDEGLMQLCNDPLSEAAAANSVTVSRKSVSLASAPPAAFLTHEQARRQGA